MQSSHIEQCVKCEFCHNIFMNELNLMEHLKAYHTAKHQCEFCYKFYGSERYVKQHIEQVHDERMQNDCNICNEKIESKFELKLHMQSNHPEQDSYCIVCNQYFQNKEDWQQYVLLVHKKARGVQV